MTRIILYENMRSVIYAPFYLALSDGCFAAAGIEVEMQSAPVTSDTAQALLDGRVDVSWGGPMRVMLLHDGDRDCPLVAFAQVVARDPFVLLGREPKPDFRWDDLRNRRIAFAVDVPTPSCTLIDDLQRAGLAPGDYVRAPDRPMAEQIAAFEAGDVDVLHTFEPYADQLIEAGAAHLWHRMSRRGDLAWTTFYTTRDFIDRDPGTCRALTGAIQVALDAVATWPAARIATAIAPWFPDMAAEALTRIIGNYREAGLWARDTALPAASFVRLKASLLAAGLITYDAPYDRLIDEGLSSGEQT